MGYKKNTNVWVFEEQKVLETNYETDEEEFWEPSELDIGFTEPFGVLLTPRKRKRLWFLLIQYKSILYFFLE